MGRARFRTGLAPDEREALQTLVDAPSTAQGLARRARIVLLANGEGWSNQAIADKLDIHKSDITVWTKRWMERKDDPVLERLGDRPRSGRPAQLDADAWCRIMAIACESPETYGRPISHWSSRELAEEVLAPGHRQTSVRRASAQGTQKKISSRIAAVTG
jgi:putative transposase